MESSTKKENISPFLKQYESLQIEDKMREQLEERRKLKNADSSKIEPEFNINIKDYSVDDIFSLLDMHNDDSDDYEDLQKNVNKKIDTYVTQFKKLKNEPMVDFFENIRTSLFGKLTNENLTEAEKLLLIYDDKYNAEKQKIFKATGSDTTEETLYDNSKGAGNPLNRKTMSKLLTVDSRFRRNYNTSSSTNYHVELPYIMQNVIEMKLSDIEFPTTYYTFNDAFENNYFWLKYCYYSGTIKVEKFVYFYIEPGNYYHTVLINNINAVFSNNGIPLYATFDLDYSNAGGVGVGTGNVSIGVDTDSSYNLIVIDEVELNFQGLKLTSDVGSYNTSHLVSDDDIVNQYYYGTSTIPYKQRCGWILGFRESMYSGATSHRSEGILDLLGTKYIYLIVDDLNTSSNVNFFSNNEESLLSDNILGRISQKGYPFSIQSQGDFSVYAEPRYYYGPVNIHKLDIKVVDEFNRIIDINNMDFSFTLSITTIYSQTN